MQQFHKFITWRFVSLNMFRAPLRPSSGAYNCLTASGFTVERGGSSLVGRGLAEYNRPDHDQLSCYNHAAR
jgi:hypothetical protein